MRVVTDTNLWISYLISNKFIKLDELMKAGEITFLFSQESLEEFVEVASRPKFEKYFSPEDLTNLIRYFDLYGEIVEVTSNIDICRDPKDNFLLNLAKDGNADFLITGDKDLLVLEQLEETTILTYRDFEDMLNKE